VLSVAKSDGIQPIERDRPRGFWRPHTAAPNVGHTIGRQGLLLHPSGRRLARCQFSRSGFEGGQHVYRQGDPAGSVFYIRSGKVKSTVVSEQGKEAVLAVLGTGDFFGEGCLTGQPQRLSTVSAITECVIVRIAKADVTRVIHEEPAFAELFISHLLARNSRVEEDLVDQLFNSSEKRLARILLLLANFGKEGRPEPIIAKISQEMLAGMIGTTRSDRGSQFLVEPGSPRSTAD
jgi:CRP/FNR family transcriptional regulator, cyclic AMP receptor protein